MTARGVVPILVYVAYRTFIKKCREIYEEKVGKTVSPDEFGKLCIKPSGAPYKKGHLRNVEEHGTKPGLPLLEEAARLAGFNFEVDCARVPEKLISGSRLQQSLDAFNDALHDWRQGDALIKVIELESMLKEKRPKTGGRLRKK